MKRRALISCLLAASAVLGACTTIGGERVEGWPALEVVEHHVPHREMRDRCARYVGFGLEPVACAEFRFAAARCDIWYSADFPPSREIIEHERQHCLGYEHAGESGLREIFARYVAWRQAQARVSASSGPSAGPASAAGAAAGM